MMAARNGGCSTRDARQPGWKMLVALFKTGLPQDAPRQVYACPYALRLQENCALCQGDAVIEQSETDSKLISAGRFTSPYEMLRFAGSPHRSEGFKSEKTFGRLSQTVRAAATFSALGCVSNANEKEGLVVFFGTYCRVDPLGEIANLGLPIRVAIEEFLKLGEAHPAF